MRRGRNVAPLCHPYPPTCAPPWPRRHWHRERKVWLPPNYRNQFAPPQSQARPNAPLCTPTAKQGFWLTAPCRAPSGPPPPAALSTSIQHEQLVAHRPAGILVSATSASHVILVR